MTHTDIMLDSTVVACKGQVSKDVDGEVVILNVNSGVYFGLNPVGAVIWGWIQEPSSVLGLRDRLLAQFPDVESEAATSLLLEFLQEMATAGLVEVAAPSHA